VRTDHDDALVPGFDLPPRPDHLRGAEVAAWSAPVLLPTYLPAEPDRYPAYLDRRVYQGSSGRVYPLPFHDRISETRTDHRWTGLHLENEHLRVLVLPELGGRIQLAVDKRTGSPLFYANPVIKPALVGLAGPWLAGGVEFNWPQHHRPATFLPTTWEVDEDDGTLWCSDHDPFARMKGMHGVRLRPGSTVIELAVRLFNRHERTQTFLWWANVAAEVHDDYQSFFPSDVTMVADHAKRAVTTFPAATTPYYGIDYPARRDLDTRSGSPHRVPGDRLDWPRNIPVPTSYMAVGSAGDFFGGYDHRAGAGFVHWADHHHAVGKKQWTWGDEEFGRTWNRNLDDEGRPYIELMAGVYTENQPDFSHLAPGETKTFSQYWYPVAGTGVVVAAGLDVALGREQVDGSTRLVLDATRPLGPTPVLVTTADGTVLSRTTVDLHPATRATVEVATEDAVAVLVGPPERPLLRWDPTATPASTELQPAVEPAAPADVPSVEELYLVGRHLEQYRHATRSPEPYWQEALRRDRGHAPSHTALGGRRYEEGRFDEAERHARAAVERLTRLNPNPETGDAHHLLGLTLLRQGRDDEAYAAFAKATWVAAWAGPGNHQLALLDARAGRDAVALQRAQAGLRAAPDQLQLRDLTVVLLRRLGRTDEADALLADTLALDPLDVWARQLAGTLDDEHGLTEAQTLLDVALENARAGELAVAAALADQARLADARRPLGQTACAVLAGYHTAVWLDALGDPTGAAAVRDRARRGDRTWNHPSRLDDVLALEAALAHDPDDPTAAALLGHWCYAHRRPERALELWRRSAAVDDTDPVVWRNLAVAAFDVEHDAAAATTAYERALHAAPGDPRLLFESDQLAKRVGTPVAERLDRLEQHPETLRARDDLAAEHAQLLLALDRPADALAVLQDRRFQPWEGGEGLVLRAWDRARLALAEAALAAGDSRAAAEHVRAALAPPASLGEARHPLANPASLLLTLGDAHAAAGQDEEARACWRDAADAVGDFADMTPTAYSEHTYPAALAARRLGDEQAAERLADGLADYVDELASTPATIDFFATSLPSLLLFADDLQRRRDLQVGVLRAQLALLAGDVDGARDRLDRVLAADPAHETALDLHHRLAPLGSPS
jgi:tetratricopeptide (TPR) repeat protein